MKDVELAASRGTESLPMRGHEARLKRLKRQMVAPYPLRAGLNPDRATLNGNGGRGYLGHASAA